MLGLGQGMAWAEAGFCTGAAYLGLVTSFLLAAWRP